METKSYIIYQKHSTEESIVLDGFKCANKGSRSEMAAIYRDLYAKAKNLVKSGQATDLKEFYDEDGTIWFSFTRDGQVMKTFLCDRKRAQLLTA